MPLRLAVVSTPRSGNTWISRVIAAAAAVPLSAKHTYEEFDAPLPAGCVIQLHWLPSRDFLEWLAQRDFRVLTIARHPLDVLISAVRFAQFEPDTARWLMGTTGMPVQLGPDGTASPEFLDYCLSDGAASLLSVTPAWWPISGTLQVRYETVVPNPRRQFGSLLRTLGVSTEGLDRALSSISLASLQAFPNRHGWRGVPGHYSALVPTASAQRIYARHQGVFATLGYRRPLFWRSHRAAAKSWKMLS